MIMAVSRKASDPKSPVLKIGTPGCFDRAQHWSEAGPQGNRSMEILDRRHMMRCYCFRTAPATDHA